MALTTWLLLCKWSRTGLPLAASLFGPWDARRTYCTYDHIDTLRPRLRPFGLLIRTVVDYGHMLLRELHES